MRSIENKWIAIILAISTITLTLRSLKEKYFMLDDALIYQRYIKNFIELGELTYNSGEKFNALTSPLFTMIALLSNYLAGEAPVSTNYVSIVFYISMFTCHIAVGFYYFKSFIQRILLILSTTILFIFLRFYYLTFGLETTLFATLIAASLLAYVNERFMLTAILIGMSIITRIETVILAFVLLVDYAYVYTRFPKTKWILISLFPIFLVSLFSYFYYDHSLPNTGAAKFWQGQSGLWGESNIFLSVSYQFSGNFGHSKTLHRSAIILSIIGFIFSIRYKFVRLYLMFVVCYFIVFWALNIPNYHWYYSPFYAFGLLTAGFALPASVQNSALSKRGRRPAAALVVVALAAFGASGFATFAPGERRGHGVYMEVASWLKQNTPQDAGVAAVEVGHLGYYSERPIVDVLGLVSPFNARYIGKRCFMDWTIHYQPDYLVAHDPLWGHEQSMAPLIERAFYREVFRHAGVVVHERVAAEAVVRDFGLRHRACPP